MILHWSVFDEEEELGPVLDYYINWCDKWNLLLNPLKTREMWIDFRKVVSPNSVSVTLINGKPIGWSGTCGLTKFAPSLNRECSTLRNCWPFRSAAKCFKSLLFFFRKYLHLFCHLLVWQCHIGTKKRVQLVISQCSKWLDCILPKHGKHLQTEDAPRPLPLQKKNKAFSFVPEAIKVLNSRSINTFSPPNICTCNMNTVHYVW